MRRLIPRVLMGLLAGAGMGIAAAQGISDPTRPPPGWMPVDPSKVSTKAPEKAEGSAGGEPVQLLLVGKTRRFALVRGDLVGEKTAGTKLVEIKRNDVVVSSERGRETLNLFPDVQKTAPKKQPGLGEKDRK